MNTKWRELPWRSTVITIWLNNGSGTFTASTLDFGTNDSTGVALGDLDNDGDIDAFVTNNNSRPDNVWLNDGSGTLVDSGQNLGADNTFAVTLGDLDGDGDLDAFVANSGGSNTVCINLTPPKKIPIDLLLLDD